VSRTELAHSRWRLAGSLAALFILALLIRLPGLLTIPRFEDESEGVLWALDIFEGDHLPVRAVRAYTGPLFAYLVAGLFQLFGPDLVWPRMLTAVFGALTVPATFLLGRAVADARVGLVAAVLAMTNPALVLMSHYGWSNSLTPFFSTVTLTAIYLGVTRRRVSVLAWGGVLAGLTLQTHSVSVFLLAGIAGWFLLTQSPKEWTTARRVGAVSLGFLVGYAPMLWNFASEWGTFVREVRVQDYAFAPVDSISSYGKRFGTVSWTVLQTSPGAPWGALACAALAAIGGQAFRGGGRDIQAVDRSRASGLAAVVLFLALALFCVFVPTPLPRYLVPLLPLMFVWLAAALDRPASTTPSSASLFGNPARRIALALAIFAGIDLAVIASRRGELEHEGITNAAFFELRSTLASRGACSEGVFLEDRPYSPAESFWVYFNLRTIRYLLIMDGCLAAMAPAPDLGTQLATRDGDAWLVLRTQSVPTVAERLHLVRIMGIEPGPLLPEPLRHALYRATPR
jgi:4-amino-4-deoxy-L-arabinose transferase-like glycosyltransferase